MLKYTRKAAINTLGKKPDVLKINLMSLVLASNKARYVSVIQ